MSDEVLKLQTNASRKAAVLTSVSKTFRMIMQSMLLGLGALLGSATGNIAGHDDCGLITIGSCLSAH